MGFQSDGSPAFSGDRPGSPAVAGIDPAAPPRPRGSAAQVAAQQRPAAVRALAASSREVRRFERVEIPVFAWNAASGRVLEKVCNGRVPRRHDSSAVGSNH
jgi:hypothetical protein